MNAIYSFTTKFETFQIRPDAAVGDGFELRIVKNDGDWERLGHYMTPVVAAGDVYSQATGYYERDDLPISAIPQEVENIAE